MVILSVNGRLGATLALTIVVSALTGCMDVWPGDGETAARGGPALFDGSYSTEGVSVFFEADAGRSLIVERQRLFDWATETGLVGLASEQAGRQDKFVLNGSPTLTGVQTLPVSEPRFVAGLQGGDQTGELWATLQGLGYDGVEQDIRADIAFEVRTTAADEGADSTPESTRMALAWEDVSLNEEQEMVVTEVRRTFTDVRGRTVMVPEGPAELANVRDVEMDGVWAFRTLLGGSEDATWMQDSRLALFSYDFSSSQMYAFSTYSPWVSSDQSWIDIELFLDVLEFTGVTPEVLTIDEPVDLYNDGDVVTLRELSLEGRNGSLVGRARATYPVSYGSEEMQDTTFEFSGGLQLVREVEVADALSTEAGYCGVDLTALDLPTLHQYSIVFSRLDLHRVENLETGVVIEEFDPEASIEIVGPWANPRLDVDIRSGSLDTLRPGHQVVLRASLEDLHYAWFAYFPGEGLCELFDPGRATERQFTFTVPEDASGEGVIGLLVWNDEQPAGYGIAYEAFSITP